MASGPWPPRLCATIDTTSWLHPPTRETRRCLPISLLWHAFARSFRSSALKQASVAKRKRQHCPVFHASCPAHPSLLHLLRTFPLSLPIEILSSRSRLKNLQIDIIWERSRWGPSTNRSTVSIGAERRRSTARVLRLFRALAGVSCGRNESRGCRNTRSRTRCWLRPSTCRCSKPATAWACLQMCCTSSPEKLDTNVGLPRNLRDQRDGGMGRKTANK